MPAFDLPRLARAQGIRKSSVTIRPIEPTQAHAQELARLYMPIVRAWQANIEAIMAGYTVPTLDALTTDSPSDQQAAIDRAEAEVSRLILGFGAGVERWAVSIERWHRSKWIGGVKAATRVDLSTVLTAQPVQESLEAFIARNVALVTDISGQAKGRISDAVFRAYQNRTPTRELARELREAVGMARKRAVRVAADQGSKLSAALDQERMAESGIELWRWRHSGKRFPREDHKARNGRIYRLGSNKRANPDGSIMKGGETIEAGDGPSEPPWCGCRRAAYLAIQSTLE